MPWPAITLLPNIFLVLRLLYTCTYIYNTYGRTKLSYTIKLTTSKEGTYTHQLLNILYGQKILFEQSKQRRWGSNHCITTIHKRYGSLRIAGLTNTINSKRQNRLLGGFNWHVKAGIIAETLPYCIYTTVLCTTY